VFAEQPNSEDYDDEVDMQEVDGDVDLQDEDVPLKKTRKFARDELIDAGEMAAHKAGDAELVLTRHFALDKEFGPLYTGGQFLISKDAKTGFALKDDKICIFELQTGVKLCTIGEENEDILTFSLSPNQQLLAASNKNFMTRVYQLSGNSFEEKPKVIQSFKTGSAMALELAFDPASRFLAMGTSNNVIKVFDC
jgi:hypothetical protein